MKIGSTLKYLRKSAKLTQKELADKCSMSRGYLADLESDRYNPSIDTLQTISDALEVPINYFFTVDNINIPPSPKYDEITREIAESVSRLPLDKKLLIKELIKSMSN